MPDDEKYDFYMHHSILPSDHFVVRIRNPYRNDMNKNFINTLNKMMDKVCRGSDHAHIARANAALGGGIGAGCYLHWLLSGSGVMKSPRHGREPPARGRISACLS